MRLFQKYNLQPRILKIFLPFIILFFIVASIIAVKSTLKSKQTLNNRAETITSPILSDRTNQLESLLTNYENSNNNRDDLKKQIMDLAASRATDMVKLAIEDPQSFMDNLLSPETRKNIPDDILNSGLIEKDISLKGTIDTSTTDNFTTGVSNTIYKIKSDLVDYNLNFTDEPKENILPGTTISIKNGIAFGNQIVFNPNDGINLTVESSPALKTSGDFNVAVIPYKFSDTFDKDDPDKPYPVSLINDSIFDNTNEFSLSRFLEKSSYGALKINGIKANKWYQLTNQSTEKDPVFRPDIPDNCNVINWSSKAQDMFNNDNKLSLEQLRNIDLFLYIFPSTINCPWSGFAFGTNVVFLNDLPDQKEIRLSILAHEVGHVLRLYHAITDNKDFIHDPFDPMSPIAFTEIGDYNALSKQKLKWPITSQTVDKNTIDADCASYGDVKTYECTYNIAPLEKETNEKIPQLLKVKKPDSNDFYFLEYRQPVDYDFYTPLGDLKKTDDSLIGGIIIRVPVLPTKAPRGAESMLLETINNSDNPYRLFLPVKENSETTFYDNTTRMSITSLPVEKDQNTAKVKIKYEAEPPLTPTPTA